MNALAVIAGQGMPDIPGEPPAFANGAFLGVGLFLIALGVAVVAGAAVVGVRRRNRGDAWDGVLKPAVVGVGAFLCGVILLSVI